MRKPRGSTRLKERAPLPEDIDPDAIDFKSIDWGEVVPADFELDPALVERIHARRKLRQLTLRVGLDQVAEAHRVAAQTGTKYQSVLRRWLAEGASRARVQRMKAGRKRKPG